MELEEVDRVKYRGIARHFAEVPVGEAWIFLLLNRREWESWESGLPAGQSEFGVSIIHSLVQPRMAFWYPVGS